MIPLTRKCFGLLAGALFMLTISYIIIPHTGQAHSLYIQAGRHFVSEGKSSPFFFCYGHHIPVDDAIRREKLNSVRIISPDGMSREVELRDEKSLHSYLVDYDQSGTWVLTAETTPGFFTMWTDQKGRKRHSIKPMSAIADQASSVETSLSSRQWTKTYVFCEEPSPKFPGAVGLTLELVPNRDLSDIMEGETLKIQAFLNGKPYSGEGFWDATYNGFSTQAEDMYIQRTQVDDGLIMLPVDMAGKWYVRFFIKSEASEENRKDYLTDKMTTTLVFEVPNERKRPKLDTH